MLGFRVRVRDNVRTRIRVLVFRVTELDITCVALSIVVDGMTPFALARPIDVVLLIGVDRVDPNPSTTQILRSVLRRFIQYNVLLAGTPRRNYCIASEIEHM